MTSAFVDLSQDRAPRCALAAAEIPLCTPLLSAPAWAGRGQRGGGGTWTGEHGNQDTRHGSWELFEGQEGEKKTNLQPANGTESCYQTQVSVSGAGTPPAFDAATTFAFVSLTSCRLNSSEAQQTSYFVPGQIFRSFYVFTCLFFVVV